MQVFAALNHSADKPHWITRDTFYKYFDQKDFLNRDVKDIKPVYLKDWFHTPADGRIFFYIPVVSALNGKTDLIGSRHRLAVLLPYLEELPIAIAPIQFQIDSRRFLETIPKRPLDTSMPFWIPDFPICEKLP